MPELPEVETVRVQLLGTVVGKTIMGVEVFHAKTVAHDKTIGKRLVGAQIDDIARVGKLMIFSFRREPDLFLLAHLKMTGQFFYADKKGRLAGGGHSVSAADVRELPGRHTRVAFHFAGGSTLYFNDMRTFGFTKLTDKAGAERAVQAFGPEPIDKNFDVDWFVREARKKKRSIKALLLDQSFVSGLGNIYVDETLWRAMLRPTRKTNTLSKTEAKAIAKEAGKVMREAIKHGGTTFQHFEDAEGKKGNFSRRLKVFGKQGQPCPRCGSLIKKIREAGRGTHFCPGCQK